MLGIRQYTGLGLPFTIRGNKHTFLSIPHVILEIVIFELRRVGHDHGRQQICEN